jgi:ring-1,2-phenylacetyl-CoA epoxidase subunit PaaE
MARFHSLIVLDIHQETADSIVVRFEVPSELREEFRFAHGQYVTLKLTVNGEELRTASAAVRWMKAPSPSR